MSGGRGACLHNFLYKFPSRKELYKTRATYATFATHNQKKGNLPCATITQFYTVPHTAT